jgi:hypothetical protein
LKPWTDFPVLQQQLFERIYKYIPRDAGLFSSTQYLTELGQDLCDRPLASEKDLEAYQRSAVERPTTHIISHLQQIEEARREFNLGGGIIFENHANTLSDSNEEVQQSLQDLRISSKGQASSSNPKPRNADQICVYKEADGTRSLCIAISEIGVLLAKHLAKNLSVRDKLKAGRIKFYPHIILKSQSKGTVQCTACYKVTVIRYKADQFFRIKTQPQGLLRFLTFTSSSCLVRP